MDSIIVASVVPGVCITVQGWLCNSLHKIAVYNVSDSFR